MLLADDRVANVKTMAARIAAYGADHSIREFLDASALAAGSLIRSIYRGPGIEIAMERYIDALRRAVRKG